MLKTQKNNGNSGNIAIIGQWGLDDDGVFKPDPWVVFHNGVPVQKGFKTVPKGYKTIVAPEGVLLPGLVNAHTHLGLSYLSQPGPGGGVFKFIRAMAAIKKPDIKESIEKAQQAIRFANRWGTFYYCDVSNDAEFSRNLGGLREFSGLRFLEILGYSPPNDDMRLQVAVEALKQDRELHPTVHSPYGSSPKIWKFCANTQESNWVSVHLLEDISENNLGRAQGEAVQFLSDIGQNFIHEISKNSELLPYIEKTGILKRPGKGGTLLVHLNEATDFDIDFLEKKSERGAIVICHRSSRFLGYIRKNWRALEKTNLPVLMGTDSKGTSPDVSMLHEISALLKEGVWKPEFIWKAATSRAYAMFNIKAEEIPCFYFQGATPDLDSLLQHEPVRLPAIDELT
ncbi:MAG: hypothetical protein ABUK01_01850 [Leptospirales bacterium]